MRERPDATDPDQPPADQPAGQAASGAGRPADQPAGPAAHPLLEWLRQAEAGGESRPDGRPDPADAADPPAPEPPPQPGVGWWDDEPVAGADPLDAPPAAAGTPDRLDDAGARRRRRRRMLAIAAVPWAVVGLAALGAAVSPSAAGPEPGDAPTAADAPTGAGPPADGPADPWDAAAGGAHPTGAGQPASDGGSPDLLAAAGAHAVAVALTDERADEPPLHVDHAVAEAVEPAADHAVVTVRTLVREPVDGEWGAPTSRRLAVPVDAAGRALDRPWPLPDAPDPRADGPGWATTDDRELLERVAAGLHEAGWEVDGLRLASGPERLLRAAGVRGPDGRATTAWLADGDPPRLLGAGADGAPGDAADGAPHPGGPASPSADPDDAADPHDPTVGSGTGGGR